MFAANSPLKFTDPDGRDLILKGDTNHLQQITSTLNQGIGGNYVKTDKNGNVSINNISGKQWSKLSNEQKALYNTVKEAVKANGDININVVSGDEVVIIGSYELESIDIADINAFGEVKGVNQYSVLGHEIKEQKEKQIENKQRNGAHDKGNDVEKEISGGYERNDKSSTLKPEADWPISGTVKTEYIKGIDNQIGVTIKIKRGNVTNVTRNEIQ